MKRKKAARRARLDRIEMAVVELRPKIRADLRRMLIQEPVPTVRTLAIHLGATGKAGIITFPILSNGPLPQIDLPALGYRVRAVTPEGDYILDSVEAGGDLTQVRRFAQAVSVSSDETKT